MMSNTDYSKDGPKRKIEEGSGTRLEKSWMALTNRSLRLSLLSSILLSRTLPRKVMEWVISSR